MKYAIGMQIFWNSESATAAVRRGRQKKGGGRQYHYMQRIEVIRHQVFHIYLTEINS